MKFLSYFPYLYFVHTRLKKRYQQISWIFIYVVPVSFIYFYYVPLNIFNIILFLLGVTVINMTYENGYIQNDVKTIKKEKNPTLRLSKTELQYFEQNFFLILLVRWIIIVILILIFGFMSSIEQVIKLINIVLILQILYYFYNINRNIINLFLLLPINYIRYFGVVIPFLNNSEIIPFIIFTVFTYPLLKVIEFLKKDSYNIKLFKKLLNNIDLFRIYYYLLNISVFSAILILFDLNVLNLKHLTSSLIISIYFFIYRFLTYFVLKKFSQKLNLEKNWVRN